MKWFHALTLLAPALGLIIHGAGVLIPSIIAAANEAELIPGADGPAKKQHVMNIVTAGAAAATLTGKVTIPPADAYTVTNAVFEAVDGVHAIAKANQAPPAV